MSQLLSHYAQSAVVFTTVFLIFALLFAVFPKAAWTDAFRDEVPAAPSGSGGDGVGVSSGAATSDSSGGVVGADGTATGGNSGGAVGAGGSATGGSGGDSSSAGGSGGASSSAGGGSGGATAGGSGGGSSSAGGAASDDVSPLADIYAIVPAPKPGISDVVVSAGQPVALRDLITVGGQRISSAGSRYSVTLHEATYYGRDGTSPTSNSLGTSVHIPYTDDGLLTFPSAGIYRICVTVNDLNGFTTTAFLFCHTTQRGFS